MNVKMLRTGHIGLVDDDTRGGRVEAGALRNER